MVTVYEYLSLVENDHSFLMLLKKGVIPLSILTKKVYYERYIYELKTVSSGQAVTNAAEEYNVSEMTIRRAIKKMTE